MSAGPDAAGAPGLRGGGSAREHGGMDDAARHHDVGGPGGLSGFDRELLEAAVEQAAKSWDEGGVPIGAAVGSPELGIVGRGHNRREQDGDPTSHGEIDALRRTGRRRDWRSLTLATTLSPCVMCTGAILLHKIGRVVIGENDTFLGREDLLVAEGVEVVLARDGRCVEMMRAMLAERPDVWAEDIGD